MFHSFTYTRFSIHNLLFNSLLYSGQKITVTGYLSTSFVTCYSGGVAKNMTEGFTLWSKSQKQEELQEMGEVTVRVQTCLMCKTLTKWVILL